MEYIGNGSRYDTATIATKTPEIEMALNELEKEISRMEDEVAGLDARLASVILPDAPRLDSNDTVSQAMHSEMFLHINTLRVRMVDLNVKLSNIKQRLEL